MSDALTIANSDRLLILAPHPDDESIATGGLIQVAHGAGAAVRVVVLTDGDNNPWPQRWIEKRWRVDAAARARWGARRRDEARAALRVLGLDAGAAVFLGLPDLGLTDVLMHNDAGAIEALRIAIEEFRPTVLVVPAVSDRHPDHSAAHILARSLLARSALSPSLYSFAVHGESAAPMDAVVLTNAQRSTKQRAILAHETQMRLSRRRFLHYAQSTESFLSEATVAGANPAHPLRARFVDRRCLQVDLDLTRWQGPWRGRVLFVALDDGSRILHRVDQHAERSGDVLRLEIECPGDALGYVKLALPQPGWRVFDRCGWQRISEAERDHRNG